MSHLRRLINEIHRRSLWQVLGAYTVASWLVWQVVGSLYEWIGLPEWVPATALVLLLVGLPIVLATALVQDGPPRAGGTARGADAAASGGSLEGLESAAATMGQRSAEPSGGPVGERREVGSKRSSLFTWSRAVTGGVLAFAALGLAASGFMGMRALGIGPAATLMSSGVLDVRDPLVLADFEVSAPDSSLGALVTEALRIDLSESTVVRLAPEAQVAAALARMGSSPERLSEEVAREVALRDGLKAVLTGEVRAAAGSFVLSARVVTSDSGRTLAAFRETAQDSTQLLATVDRLSERIRAKIGESLKSTRAAEPLERVTTSSLAALRLYSEGLYNEAVAVDSTFAMAWRKIGVNLGNYGLQRARQVEAFTRAYELSDRLGPRERGLAVSSYHMSVTGDLQEAQRALATLLASFPDDHIAHNNLALIHGLRGNFRSAAASFRKAVEILPRTVYGTNLALALYGQREVEAAFATLDSLEMARPEAWTALRTRARLLTAETRYSEADSVAAVMDAREGPGPTWFAAEVAARSDGARGRIGEATEHIDVMRQLALEPDLDLLVPERIALAAAAAELVAGVVGDQARAVSMLDSAVRETPLESLEPLDRPYGELAEAYAYAGELNRARALTAAYDSVAPGHWSPGEDQLEPALRAKGLVALHEGRAEDALLHFTRVQEEIPSCREVCVLALIGRAHEAAARPDAAMAAYERYVDARDYDRWRADALHLGFVLQRLGELHENAGDRGEAARYYGRFIEIWRESDTELQPRVEAAKRSLARLASEGAPGR